MKYDHLIAEIGAIDSVNLFGFRYVEWLAFAWQYPLIDEGVRQSWIEKHFEGFSGAKCSNCVSSQDADWSQPTGTLFSRWLICISCLHGFFHCRYEDRKGFNGVDVVSHADVVSYIYNCTTVCNIV